MMQFRKEGEPAFQAENTGNENPAASSAENTNTNPTGSSDQNQTQTQDKKEGDPGTRDPESGLNNPTVERWQQRENDWKERYNQQEQRHLAEITKLREEMTKLGGAKPADENQQFSAEQNTQVPDWFGGDDKAWQGFLSWQAQQIAKAKQEARTETLSEIQNKSTEEQKRIDDATQYFNTEVASIEGDKELNPQGQSIDRNKLLKTAMDNDLVDSKGRWNYKAAFKLMKPAEVFKAKEALNEKKQIAGATTSDSRAENKAPNYVTSDDFKKPGARPW